MYAKAYGYYAAKDYDSAIAVCDERLAQNPNCDWAYDVKGLAYYFANGNSVAKQALALIDKAIAIAPDTSFPYFNEALIYKGLKEYDKSMADFNKVISMDPNNTWSYYGIATIYGDTDQADLTIQYLADAVVLDPINVRAQAKDDLYRHFSKIKDDPRFKVLIYPE